MNSLTGKTEETLANAADAIIEDLNLNTDSEEVGDDAISVLSDECEDGKVEEVKAMSHDTDKMELIQNSIHFKVNRTSEATLPSREPRPLFLGRPDKKRRNRGSRKNKKQPNVQNNGSGLPQSRNSNESHDANDPNSKNNNIEMVTSQQDVSNKMQTVSNESTEPMESTENQPATPNRKMVKISRPPANPTQGNPKTKPNALAALIEKYGSHHKGIAHENQPWNARFTASNQHAPRQPKRPLSKNNSPANNSKRQRTFADVLSDDLILFITDKNGDIDDDKAGKLEKKLMEKFDTRK